MAGRNRFLAGLQRIMRSFAPKEENFFELFSDISDCAVEAASCLQDCVNNFDGLPLAVEQMTRIEHKADEVVHETVHRLNNTFVTPALFDREDIYRIIDHMDDIVDQAKGAIDRMQLYHVGEPTARCKELVTLLNEATQALQSSMHRLSSINPTDSSYVSRINTIENQADVVHRAAMSELFETEPDARNILKWLQIYQFVEGAIDACEDAANLVAAVVVKNA